MFKHKIIFTLFFLYSSFLITEEDNVEVDLLFLKIQELEIEIAELRNILESQNYLIQKLIQESASDNIEDKDCHTAMVMLGVTDGSGGGGSSWAYNGGAVNGGSGIVIIRWA